MLTGALGLAIMLEQHPAVVGDILRHREQIQLRRSVAGLTRDIDAVVARFGADPQTAYDAALLLIQDRGGARPTTTARARRCAARLYAPLAIAAGLLLAAALSLLW